MELGPRDIERQKFVCVCRDNGEKKDVQMSKGVQRVKQELDDICSAGCFRSEGGATSEENMEGGGGV